MILTKLIIIYLMQIVQVQPFKRSYLTYYAVFFVKTCSVCIKTNRVKKL